MKGLAMKDNILIVDDEADILSMLQFAFSTEKFKVTTASNGKDALKIFRNGNFDLVLTDIKMPVMDGLELLRCLKEAKPNVEVIVLTGYASLENAIEALKDGGAFDFIQKPLDDINHLIIIVKRALERRRLKKDKEQMQAALKASERFNQAIINTMPSHLLVLDKNGRIIKVNRSWEQFISSHFEACLRPAIGDTYLATCVSNMEPLAGEEIKAGLKRLFKGEIEQFEKEFLCKKIKPDKWLLMQASRLEDSDGFVVISQIDITMLKAMETELIHARKTEAIMTLVGGIAHQYNNALNTVTGPADILGFHLKNDEYAQRMLSMIRKSALRMGKFNNQLTSYAESGLYKKNIIPLNPLIRSALDLIKNSLKPSLKVRLDLSDDVLYVKGDDSKLKAMIHEILMNAVEATKETGCIIISSKKIWMENPPSESASQIPGDYNVVSFKDDGVGMEDKIKSRIFDPFFTTNFIGRGLGLPAAHGIVRNHGGWIRIDSKIGIGTEMNVFLPVYDKSAGKGDADY